MFLNVFIVWEKCVFFNLTIRVCSLSYNLTLTWFLDVLYHLYISVTPETSNKLREKLLQRVDSHRLSSSPAPLTSTQTSSSSSTPYHNHTIYLNDEEIDSTTWSMNLWCRWLDLEMNIVELEDDPNKAYIGRYWG